MLSQSDENGTLSSQNKVCYRVTIFDVECFRRGATLKFSLASVFYDLLINVVLFISLCLFYYFSC